MLCYLDVSIFSDLNRFMSNSFNICTSFLKEYLFYYFIRLRLYLIHYQFDEITNDLYRFVHKISISIC